MKLATSIKPRRDGSVVARCPSGTVHTFKAEADGGELVAEVADQADIAFLLRQGGDAFYPADDGDFAAAGAILESTATDADDDDDIDPDNPDGDDGEGDMNAAPVEANTPPARVKPAAKKAAGGKKKAAG